MDDPRNDPRIHKQLSHSLFHSAFRLPLLVSIDNGWRRGKQSSTSTLDHAGSCWIMLDARVHTEYMHACMHHCLLIASEHWPGPAQHPQQHQEMRRRRRELGHRSCLPPTELEAGFTCAYNTALCMWCLTSWEPSNPPCRVLHVSTLVSRPPRLHFHVR